MLHVTPTSAVACVPTHVPASHPDAELLALAPTLEAAFLAFDHHRRTDTRDDIAMYDERRDLFGAVDAAAGRILAIRPETMPGLLLMARAAAAASDWLWDPEDDDADREGLALRALCDAIFALAGTDRRGQTFVGAGSPVESGPDKELAAMMAEWMDLRDRVAACPRAEDGADRKFALQQEILFRPCAGLADLCAKLPLFREEEDVAGPASIADDEADLSLSAWRCVIRDLEHLSGAPGGRQNASLSSAGIDRLGQPGAEEQPFPIRTPDPVLAAISKCRATILEHIAACEAPDAETPDGDARRSAAGGAAFAAWNTLMATTPTTVVGVQVLARFVPEYIEAGGAYDDLRDHNRIFRLIAAADLPGGDSSDAHPIPTRIRTPEVAPWPMAAE